MEDFDNYHTIEVNGPKGWEVIFKTHDHHKAIERYREEYGNGGQVRLTSPKSIVR